MDNSKRGRRNLRLASIAGLAGLAAATLVAGCGMGSQTPLPDLGAVSSTGLSQTEKAKAIADMNHAGATHAQEAEQQIEQSR